MKNDSTYTNSIIHSIQHCIGSTLAILINEMLYNIVLVRKILLKNQQKNYNYLHNI